MANSKVLKSFWVFLLVLGGCLKVYGYSQPSRSWYEKGDVGWSWYKESPVKSQKARKFPNKDERFSCGAKPGPETNSPDAYFYTRQAEKVRKDFEEAVSRAVLYPTLENVQEAQRLYNGVMTRASHFEQSWMFASLLSAENYRESDNPSLQHRKIYEEKKDKELESEIRTLAKTYGIFFLFKHECPYCHQMAPVVKGLEQSYGFVVKAISPDGDPLELFPNAVRDNGAISQINPEGIYPVVFLVNPHTRLTIPLARGLMSPSELKANFRVILQFLKEQAHAKP